MIGFTASPHQQKVINEARAFVAEHLLKAVEGYKGLSTPKERFLAIKPVFEAAVKAGVLKDSVPERLGGGCKSLIDSAIQWEEYSSVDPAIGITCLAHCLGLGPIIHGGTAEQQAKYLAPFLSNEGYPIASLAFTEVGGGANWLTDKGMKTTIVRDGNEWVINGEKIWPNMAGGFDNKGATVCCVVGRTSMEDSPMDCAACVVVTREDIARNAAGAFRIVRDPVAIGLTASSGPHIQWVNLRVPLSNMLGTPGPEAIRLVVRSFAESAALVGAIAVGIMRRAFETTLTFAQKDTRNGPHPIIGYQSPADILVDAKAKMEASRALVWRACDDIDNERGEERYFLAKIFASEAAMDVVVGCARVIGIASFDKTHFAFDEMMADALCMSIFDGGNIAVRRRQVQAIFSDPAYTPEVSRGF